MTRAAELNAAWATYMKAVNAHSEAASVLYARVLGSTQPTEVEVQREADTRVIMVGARTAYADARDGPAVIS